MRERIAWSLRDNRVAWEANTTNATQQLSNDLCIGAVYVENVVNTLMRSLQYASAEQRKELESSGVELFYLLAELINNDVKRCHPAIQFFSSCTEVLGKVSLSLAFTLYFNACQNTWNARLNFLLNATSPLPPLQTMLFH